MKFLTIYPYLATYASFGGGGSHISYANLNLSNHDIELQCLIIRPPFQRKFNLMNIYRPPSGNFQNFADILVEQLDQITSMETVETFVMGDFNIDIKDPDTPNALLLSENLLHLGLMQKITSPTQHSKNNQSSLIDHIYTDSKSILESCNVTLNISDHDLIYIIRKKKKAPSTKTTFLGRSYRNYDRDAFQESLVNMDWERFYLTDEVEQAWSYLEDVIRDKIDVMCPVKNIKIK